MNSLFENLQLLRESNTHNNRNNLAEDAIGIILAGSDDWVDYLTSDIEYTYEWFDDICTIEFTVEGEYIGSWELEKDLMTDINYLNNISAEVEAAVSGIEGLNENLSILNFEDWLDRYFDDLVKKYADKYEIPEEDVYSEDEDFEEYVNDKYEEYYRNTNRYLDDEEELDEDFEVSDTKQKYTSAKTSINSSKLPAIFKMINLPSGTINLDFGGGRFDNVAEYYADKDVTNLVYDPYNRSSAHNKEVLNQIKENGGADSVTCSNVLNVIAEPEARLTVIKNIYNLAKSGAPCYFTVYEGSGSGEGAETKSGYQLNKKTADYLEEIQQVFPNAKRKGKLIVAIK